MSIKIDPDSFIAAISRTFMINCPSCKHENSKSSNYCVKCGMLLPNKKKQIVIDLDKYYQLKNDANMSIFDKIKKEIKKL